MTKKNYVAAARIVNQLEKKHRKFAAELFIELFAPDNSFFNRARFLMACGVNDE